MRVKPVKTPPPAPPPKPGEWPETVPILRPEDFCRGWPGDADPPYDLGGWLEKIFDRGSFSKTPCRNKAYNVLLSLIEERSLHRSVWEFNDAAEVTGDDLAAIWLVLLRRLDYDV